MTSLVPVALFGWIPVLLVLFSVCPLRRALVGSLLAGWMLLPVTTFSFGGLPDFDKRVATSAGAALALLFARRVPRGAPLGLADLPIAVWCVTPLLSSLSNGLGLYDGLSATLHTGILWGLPYLAGRRLLADPRGRSILLRGLVLAGVAYLPLCWFEMRMSPQLHRIFYGFHPHEFQQAIREGGYRPVVFMQHGLMVSAFLAASALCAAWALRSPSSIGLRPWFLRGSFLALLATIPLCRSVNAIVLTLLGLTVLAAASRFRSRAPLAVLVLLPPLYMAGRTAGLLRDEVFLSAVSGILGKDRVDSLRFRLEQEEPLVEKALERPLLGWGRWGRNRVLDESRRDVSVTDGTWVIAFGEKGVVGLVALYAVLLLPAVRLLRRPAADWTTPERGPEAALATLLVLHGIDDLMNEMFNPIYLLAAGALGAASSTAIAPPGPHAEGGRGARAGAPRPPVRRSAATTRSGSAG